MEEHEKFRYKTWQEIEETAAQRGLRINFLEDLTPLARPVIVGPFTAPNSLATHPMEGCDGEKDGSPSRLTFRRCQRLAAGGAGLLWFEAAAVVPEGRANPRQLYLHRGNQASFQELVAASRKEAVKSMGEGHRPLAILQLTHSGRYSKPRGKPEPVIAFHDPHLDSGAGVDAGQETISDGELEALQDRYVETALLAREAGFDGVDIKSCHRYLSSELLAAYTREGRYGGSFENRSRFLLETVEKIRNKMYSQDFLLAVRLNLYDGIPHPYGFGVDRADHHQPDLTEPKMIVSLLQKRGVCLLNVSAGNPYYAPHIGRPYDVPIEGGARPPEHPLKGVSRLFDLAREIQEASPGMAVVGTGYSWLRQFLGIAAAANLAEGAARFVGVGRAAFAYPDFAKDLLSVGRMDKSKVCICCSKCTQIMRDGGRTGCVIRDKEVYLPIYREGAAGQNKK